jgi:hypothetical protein
MLEEQNPWRAPQGANVQLVHHNDAGSRYTSNDYTQTLIDDGVLASIGIGSVGDAYDCPLGSRALGWTERSGERAPSLNDALASFPATKVLSPARRHHRKDSIMQPWSLKMPPENGSTGPRELFSTLKTRESRGSRA